MEIRFPRQPRNPSGAAVKMPPCSASRGAAGGPREAAAIKNLMAKTGTPSTVAHNLAGASLAQGLGGDESRVRLTVRIDCEFQILHQLHSNHRINLMYPPYSSKFTTR